MIVLRVKSARATAVIFVIFAFVFFGCAGEQMRTADMQQRGGVAQAGSSASVDGQAAQAKGSGAAKAGAEEAVMCLCEQYTVKKGDSLWWIAKYRDIYNDPFLWPVIYDANKDIIKNPKRLYPGQELDIPRGGYSLEEIKNIRKKAGAKKPYMPKQQANLPMD